MFENRVFCANDALGGIVDFILQFVTKYNLKEHNIIIIIHFRFKSFTNDIGTRIFALPLSKGRVSAR